MSSKTKTTATQEARPALVPKLRFPEFLENGEWKLIPLKDLADRGKKKNRDEKIERVLTNSAEFGVMDQRDFFDKDIATQGKLESYVVVELGDYVYNPRISATAPVGPISKNNIGTGVMSPLYTTFRFKNPENGFYQHYFKTTGWHTYMRQASSTGARYDRMAIGSDDFMAMPLPVAPSPAEQQKIAECLSSVDELMAAQARKVEALKTHKKGLMQQLFPREGETQPRLRFPEFQNAGEWVQKTVGDVSDVLMCKRIFSEETNPNEGVPFYKIGTLGGVPNAFISKEKFEDYKSRYNYPRKGEVLITCSGTIGKCLPFDGKDAYFQDSNIVWLDNPTGEVSNEFLLMLLSNVNWGTLNSTTITRIYGPDLRGVSIKFPDNEAEQQRIATCLSNLDALITAETQKLEALKTHKKGLMQQLFPSVGGVAGEA